MKPFISVFLTTLFLITVLGAQPDPEQKYWENVSVFQDNQNQPHAFKRSYQTVEAAVQNKKSECPFVRSLNGTWSFKWFKKPEMVPDHFYKPTFATRNWDSIENPSVWQMKGYGHPKFRNLSLTFESDPPKIPDYYNPTGLYKKTFTIPQEWKNKEIMLRMEGVSSASYYWINGKYLGYNEGSFEPAEFNITSLVKQGKNHLAVKVLRFCDGSYLENQDMWRLSGIFRDVQLYAVPKVHVRDYYVITDLDQQYQDAELRVKLDVVNAGKAKISDYSVSIDVRDKQSNSIFQEEIIHNNLNIPASGEQVIDLTTHVNNPRKWSAEKPDLYTLVVALQNKKGETVESFSQKIGFREVEQEEGRILINGEPVKFKAVNSHMHHPEHAYTVPLDTLRKDLLLMKRHNINCVRTSHYPPTPEYLDLADRLGVYVIDEVNDEAHFNTYLSEDTSWQAMYEDRSRKLVYRDRNHPSVIMWSAGNETGTGENIDAVIKTGKQIDPSRPAWMYGGNTFHIPFEDVVGPRYWKPYKLRNLAEGNISPEDDNRPSFMDEYLAATGNSVGGLNEYWDLIYTYPRLTGGAIWDWVSPAINMPLRILPDNSPQKNNGVIMGRPEFTKGKNGQALSFSGHDDYVEFYNSHSLDISNDQLTIAFWVKPYQIPQSNNFVQKGSYQYGIKQTTTDSLEFFTYTGNRNTATTEIPEDWYQNWHHITGIYDGTHLSLYIDYTLAAQTKTSGNIYQTPFPLCIGRNGQPHTQGRISGRLSKLQIDDLYIFNKSLQIDDLKNLDPDAPAQQPVLSMNFEREYTRGDFYSTGLGGRTYGIVWPDRKVQPEIHQIKKTQQPVHIEAANLNQGLIELTNRYHFTNLNQLDASWHLSYGGKEADSGTFNIDLAPGQSKEIQLPFRDALTNNPKECIVLIQFQLREDKQWAPKGHEVAWEQFVLNDYKPDQSDQPAKLQDIKVNQTKDRIRLSGEHFEYKLNKTTGSFSQMTFKGHDYLKKGPLFTVWRAPLANEKDSWGAYRILKNYHNPIYGNGISSQWFTLGLDSLEHHVEEIDVRHNDSLVTITIQTYSSSYKGKNAFERTEIYKISEDGTIVLDQSIIPKGKLPDYLPKTGLKFNIPRSMKFVNWYGRGPFETYPDRKTGAKIGLYTDQIDSAYVPYLIPQDYGNKTDVRWLKIMNEEERGLYITSGNSFNFSLHPYSTDHLTRAQYAYQLERSGHNILHVDYEVSGVGGTAVKALQKYRVLPSEKQYQLKIKPF